MRSFKDYEYMAALDLPESERAVLEARFDDVVSGFAVLDDYDTDGVLPLVSVLDLHSVLRDDVSAKFVSREVLLDNAPESSDGYFQVPAAIE